MTGPQIFALCCGVLGIGLGLLFAFYPDILAGAYVGKMSGTATGKKLQKELAPRPLVVVFYRIAGVLVALVGVGIVIAAAIGTLR